MIKVTSPYMKKCERDLLKRFAKFVFAVMVRNTPLSNASLRKADIHIKVVKNQDLTEDDHPYTFKKYAAWVHNKGLVNGRRKYVIALNACSLN